MGGDLTAPSLSAGFEKKWRVLFINVGVNSTVRFSSLEKIEFMTFPTFNLNIRYQFPNSVSILKLVYLYKLNTTM